MSLPILRLLLFLVLACQVLLTAPALADECPERRNWSLALRVDNDLFGGRGQDQGYSNGLQLTAVSPNIADYAGDPCLSAPARALNRYLDWLQPGAYDQRNMVLAVQQALYTPADKLPRTVIANDRPYAAALLFSVGYNARAGDSLRASHLRLGVVGPAALGHEVQDAWHKLIGVSRFHGWDNQLHNEPVFQFIHERLHKYTYAPLARDFSHDLILHWGGALGNFGTHANAGFEWRLGWHLPDDFGSAPLRPAGENAAPRSGGEQAWGGHLFVNLDSRWVLRDITLDGNTFRDSHHVDKRKFVTDLGFGMALTYGEWKFAFARYFRSREFHGQHERPVYGSFTIGRRF